MFDSHVCFDHITFTEYFHISVQGRCVSRAAPSSSNSLNLIIHQTVTSPLTMVVIVVVILVWLTAAQHSLLLQLVILYFINVRLAFFYTKAFVYNSVATCLTMIKSIHHTVYCFKDGCAGLVEVRADKKCPSVYSSLACFSDAVATWPCNVLTVSHVWDMILSISTAVVQQLTCTKS